MPGSRKSWRWYGLPTTVILIGTLSIILLLWVGRVSEKLHINSAIVDAIMDVQIHAATYHLRLEEALSGNAAVDMKEALTALDQAIYLVDVTLKGGKAEHDWISEPLRDPELRARAGEIKSLLTKIRAIGLERLRDPGNSGNNSVSEHQFEAVFREVLRKTRDLEDVLEIDEARNQEKSRLLFLGILIVWAFLVTASSVGLSNRERARQKAEEELLTANKQLLSQAEELTGHREHLATLVEKRTAELTTANEQLRVEVTERRQTEETLREREKQILQLSTRLVTAQEIERKRISMELHDELGQALNVMKLRVRVIEKGLCEGQRTLREECEGLLNYMDHTIEDIRRLSLALSPTILEDLGLTSALRWLVSNFTSIHTVKALADIAEIDHLLPRCHWITIYRVIQEALTNIGKHAHAENLSVIARCQEDTVIFSVEDDGRGFDLRQAAVKDAPEKGLGLATMAERMRTLGGELDLWSRKGKGTRITFSIPQKRGCVT